MSTSPQRKVTGAGFVRDDGYRIESRITEGPVFETCLTYDVERARRVVLKIPSSHSSDAETEFRQWRRRCAEVVTNLSHPNILRPIASLESEDDVGPVFPFYEHCELETLTAIAVKTLA